MKKALLLAALIAIAGPLKAMDDSRSAPDTRPVSYSYCPQN
ncbi:hypothetical protein [Aliiroseovarius lamellibrachiae]|nr:hypothetical protein [Aliiroseovarius lamellibrachiae]